MVPLLRFVSGCFNSADAVSLIIPSERKTNSVSETGLCQQFSQNCGGTHRTVIACLCQSLLYCRVFAFLLIQ